LRSRFNSFRASRFCSFSFCFVTFSPGVDVAAGEDVDVGWADAEAEGMGWTLRGLNF
jgi:hypothetical protein